MSVTVTDPVTIGEIAVRLGYSPNVVSKWRHRGILPDPATELLGNSGSSYRPRALWDWADILKWAEESGRDRRLLSKG